MRQRCLSLRSLRAGDATFQTSTLNYPLTGLYQGQLYTLLAEAKTKWGPLRLCCFWEPVSAPEAPRDVALLIIHRT